MRQQRGRLEDQLCEAKVCLKRRAGEDMPKRVIDFDAMWASDKLASCAEWAQTEYAWLYGLADASGSFEMTNLRVIWGRVAAIRRNLTLELLGQVFDEFIARGLLFTWEQNGKRYGHWTGSDIPGRLPPPSWRMRLEKLAPPIPRAALAAYSARFGGRREGVAFGESKPLPSPTWLDSQVAGLKHEVEEAQAQDWDLGLDLGLKKEKQEVCPAPPMVMNAAAEMPTEACKDSPEALLEIYEAECGVLPRAGGLTPERRRRCAHWLTAGFTLEEFRAAVQRAAETPFLAGGGDRGWQASFDWFIANRSNVRKVLDGDYEPSGHATARRSRPAKHHVADLYAGAGPRAADRGVRVNAAALERILARGARPAQTNAQAAQSQSSARSRAAPGDG
jgi:hypothetical protein